MMIGKEVVGLLYTDLSEGNKCSIRYAYTVGFLFICKYIRPSLN